MLLVPGGVMDPCRFIPKIADFGLSRIRGALTITSSAGTSAALRSAGTLAWMAPELLSGGRASEASGAAARGHSRFAQPRWLTAAHVPALSAQTCTRSR